MRYEVIIVFDDARHERHTDARSLDDAAGAALKLADALGRQSHANEGGRPCWVEIRSGGHLELSIQVVPGGLNPKGDAPKSRAI